MTFEAPLRDRDRLRRHPERQATDQGAGRARRRQARRPEEGTDTMLIDVRGIPGNGPLHAHVTRRLETVLGRLAVRPVAVQACFFDDNGPKGGIDARCALTVRLPYRPSVRVEEMGETPRAAFDRVFDLLARRLERYVVRDRESKRRPKKYFVAKRLLAGAGARRDRRPPPAAAGS